MKGFVAIVMTVLSLLAVGAFATDVQFDFTDQTPAAAPAAPGAGAYPGVPLSGVPAASPDAGMALTSQQFVTGVNCSPQARKQTFPTSMVVYPNALVRQPEKFGWMNQHEMEVISETSGCGDQTDWVGIGNMWKALKIENGVLKVIRPPKKGKPCYNKVIRIVVYFTATLWDKYNEVTASTGCVQAQACQQTQLCQTRPRFVYVGQARRVTTTPVLAAAAPSIRDTGGVFVPGDLLCDRNNGGTFINSNCATGGNGYGASTSAAVAIGGGSAIGPNGATSWQSTAYQGASANP